MDYFLQSETFLFKRPKLMFDRKKSDKDHFLGYIHMYVYLPIIPTTDNSKKNLQSKALQIL